MKPLKNARHEKFVLNLFQGMAQDEAYIKAGFKVVGARGNASRLIANDSIQKRLASLNESVALTAKTSKEMKLVVLEEIFNHKPIPDSITARERVFAISEHNKMTGDYAPEKHAILGGIIIEVVYKDAIKQEA